MSINRTFGAGLAGLIALTALLAAPAAWAGGFGLLVELPPDRTSKGKQGAVLLVQPGGCFGPGATVTATAEGVVNGRRQSIPLRLTTVDTDRHGLTRYAIRRQWPGEGAWLLSFAATSTRPAANGESFTARCYALLELDPNGGIPTTRLSRHGERRYLPVRYIKSRPGEVESALQTLTARQRKAVTLSRSAR